MKDVGDSAYQTVLRARRKDKDESVEEECGDAKNSNGSNLTEQFDNSLDFDKSTEENDDDDDAKGESTEEDIETDVEDHHALNKRRQPSLASQQELARKRGSALRSRCYTNTHHGRSSRKSRKETFVCEATIDYPEAHANRTTPKPEKG